MPKPKLFPERPKPSDQADTRDTHERFNDLAGKVFSTPKATIDEREKQWKTHPPSRVRRD